MANMTTSPENWIFYAFRLMSMSSNCHISWCSLWSLSVIVHGRYSYGVQYHKYQYHKYFMPNWL